MLDTRGPFFECAELSLESSRKAILASREFGDNAEAALESLADAILTSGLVMQAYGSSRPAASAEHTIGHFFEMSGKVGNEQFDLHGILVGEACRMIFQIYKEILDYFKEADTSRVNEIFQSVLQDLPRKPSDYIEALGEEIVPYLNKVEKEMASGLLETENTISRIKGYRENFPFILELLERCAAELEESLETLKGIHFPFGADKLKIPKDIYRQVLLFTPYLRDRWSLFMFMRDMNLDFTKSVTTEP